MKMLMMMIMFVCWNHKWWIGFGGNINGSIATVLFIIYNRQSVRQMDGWSDGWLDGQVD